MAFIRQPRHSQIIPPTYANQWLTSCPVCSIPRKEYRYLYIERQLDGRAGLDVLEKRKILCPYQELNPGPSI